MQLWAILPELWLAAVGLVLVPVAGWLRGPRQTLPMVAAAIGLVVAMALTARMLLWPPQSVFCGTYAVDGFGQVFKLLIQAGGLITVLAAGSYFKGHSQMAQAPVVLVFATLGAMGVAASLDLVLIMLFLQLLSLSSYLLVAMVMGDRMANEAALKFFLYAAAALAVMAYGMTFFYGLTGSLAIQTIGPMLLREGIGAWVALGAGLVLVGYAFEATVVPFHFWAPDVYQGSTAPIAGFLSVVPKIACLAGLLRFLLTALPDGMVFWPQAIAALSAVTMVWGNLAALRQTRMKRLLAYSSIAQAGYVLMAVAVADRVPGALSAAGYYLAAYLFMNLGAFTVTAQVERAIGTDAIAALRGLGRRAPAPAMVMALSLLSLAGIPPLAGFAGKIFLFLAVLDGRLTWLAVLAAVNMTVALYYYIAVAAQMYFRAPLHPAPLPTNRWGALALGLSLAGTLFLGFAPNFTLELTGLMASVFR